MNVNNNLIVAQLGARMHYATPRILFRHGVLNRFYTDVYFPRNHWSQFWIEALFSRKVASKTSRYQTDISEDLVSYNNYDGLATKAALARTRSPLKCARANIRAAQRLASRIVRHEKRVENVGIYGFDTASMELFGWAAPQGYRLVLEQCVAPRATQKRVLTRLHASAGLLVSDDEIAAWDLLASRERAEWQLANLIICPSDYVRTELIALGVPETRTALVPYGVSANPPADVEDAMARRRKKSGQPLRVLFVGEVGFRKGILDLWEAAGRLKGRSFEFVAAGGVALPKSLLPRITPHLKLLGQCTRAQLALEYANADCFVLPSHLEGSATVTYEALSWGLPVVTTFESGSVVEPGKSGLLGQAGDVDFLLNSLRRLGEDAPLRQQMSHAALARSREFTVEQYGDRLMAALQGRNRL